MMGESCVCFRLWSLHNLPDNGQPNLIFPLLFAITQEHSLTFQNFLNIAEHRQTSLNITKHHWPLINQKMKNITKQCWLLMINYQMCQISLNVAKHLPYARHHKLLLITSLSWIQAIHKDRIFWKNLLKNKEMVFGNGVKNIQATGYNGVHWVPYACHYKPCMAYKRERLQFESSLWWRAYGRCFVVILFY